MTGLEWVAENIELMQRVCGAMASRRGLPPSVADDMLSEVVFERANRVMRNFDPEKGKLKAYMITNMKWYMFKWLNKRAISLSTGALTDDMHFEESGVNLEITDQVLQILDRMCPYDRGLLELRHLDGCTFEEIGRLYINKSKATASRDYYTALRRARELVSGQV